jgi:putative heme-binding domain-containing protein
MDDHNKTRIQATMTLLWFSSAFVLTAQTPPEPSPQPSNLTSQDLARGKQLFEAQCAPCHGIHGTGGRGANLALPTLKHAADDAALFSVIRYGIENTGMPETWQMTDREIWLVVAHVRALGRVAAETLPGDPLKGKLLFETQGCSTCHIVNGTGGGLGPDLDEVGARRSASHLRQCLLSPASALPAGFMMIRAIRQDGSAVEGIRVNEDSFTIQLLDLSGHFHSLRKRQLQRLDYQSGTTPMPSYRNKLSSLEIDDLIAYLAGLRGKS